MKGEHKMLNKLFLRILVPVCALFIVPVIYAGEWRDDFDGPNLDPVWTVDDMDGDPNLKASLKDGKLLMFLKGQHVWWGDPEVTDALKVTQPDPPGDWTAIAYMSYSWEEKPSSDCATSGMIHYTPGTAQNFTTCIRHKDTVMQEGWNNGEVYKNIPLPLGGATDMFMKLDKVGTINTFSYKLKEADEWIELSSVDQPIENGLVGLCHRSYCDINDATMSVDFYSLSGDQVKGAAVQPQDKLAASWGEIKATY